MPKFVINNANQGAFLIQTDNNFTQVEASVVAQGDATCTDLGTVKRTYSFDGVRNRGGERSGRIR